MSLHTFRKDGITSAAVVVTACAGLAMTGPSASAALADCTAGLNPQFESWIAQCTAPHTVSIQMDRTWYWLSSPGLYHYASWTAGHQVVPGTPWNERIYSVPEQITVQFCLTAYQDSTVQIAPRTCSFRA